MVTSAFPHTVASTLGSVGNGEGVDPAPQMKAGISVSSALSASIALPPHVAAARFLRQGSLESAVQPHMNSGMSSRFASVGSSAPHTAADTLAADWGHAYSRLEAAYPASDPDTAAKYWPPVSRIDNVAGDRNLVCSCPPLTEYLGAAE